MESVKGNLNAEWPSTHFVYHIHPQPRAFAQIASAMTHFDRTNAETEPPPLLEPPAFGEANPFRFGFCPQMRTTQLQNRVHCPIGRENIVPPTEQQNAVRYGIDVSVFCITGPEMAGNADAIVMVSLHQQGDL